MTKKKVAFIEAKAAGTTAYTDFLRKWPLLGPVTMATMLRERGHDVAVYCENNSGSVLDDDKVLGDILDSDFISVTALTPTIPRAYEIARRLRAAGTKAKLAIGGSHATFMPEEAARFFPCVVRGEGENVIAGLVEGGIPAQGIISATPVEDLDSLPTPDLALLHQHEKLWKTSLWKDSYEVPIATSRGCPFGCSYCSVTAMFGRRCRYRSPERVYQDVLHYHDQGFRSVFFYDDNFTADRARTAKLLELITPLHIRWLAQARIDLAWEDPASRTKLDTRLLAGMRDSGVDLLFIGYETLDERTAKDWNKGYKGTDALVSRFEQDTRVLHDHGVWVHGMFVFGPQHDAATFRAILDFVNRNRIDSIQISLLTPFPGTAMMEQMKSGLIFTNFPDDWRFFDGAHATYHHRTMGIRALHEAMISAHRSYYHGLLHQWGRLQHMLLSRGKPHRRLVAGVRSALRVRRLFKTWEAENAQFIGEVARRGTHYLDPA